MKIHEIIFDDGRACQGCAFHERSDEPSGEVIFECTAGLCDRAAIRTEDAIDFFGKARDAGFPAVAAILNHYDLWEAFDSVMIAATGSAHAARIHFVEQHLAPAIFEHGYPPQKEAAA